MDVAIENSDNQRNSNTPGGTNINTLTLLYDINGNVEKMVSLIELNNITLSNIAGFFDVLGSNPFVQLFLSTTAFTKNTYDMQIIYSASVPPTMPSMNIKLSQPGRSSFIMICSSCRLKYQHITEWIIDN